MGLDELSDAKVQGRHGSEALGQQAVSEPQDPTLVGQLTNVWFGSLSGCRHHLCATLVAGSGRGGKVHDNGFG